MRILQLCRNLPCSRPAASPMWQAPAPCAERLGAEPRVLLPGFAPILALHDAVEVARLPPAGLEAALPACCVEAPARGRRRRLRDRRPAFYLRAAAPTPTRSSTPTPTTIGVSPCSAGARPSSPRGWTGAGGHRWCTRTTGTPRWRRPVCRQRDERASAACPRPSTRCTTSPTSLFRSHHFAELGLPPPFFWMHGLEFHGRINFMKAGLYYADRITTVSPGYAREIQPRNKAAAWTASARAHDLRASSTAWMNRCGIRRSTCCPRATSAGHWRARRAARRVCSRNSAWPPRPTWPLFCVVSRLTDQKGLHLILQALPELVARGAQFALLGSGDAALGGSLPRRGRGDPGRRRRTDRLRRGLRPPAHRRQRRDPRPVAFRALWADPALRPQVRHLAAGAPRRGAGRHSGRPPRDAGRGRDRVRLRRFLRRWPAWCRPARACPVPPPADWKSVQPRAMAPPFGAGAMPPTVPRAVPQTQPIDRRGANDAPHDTGLRMQACLDPLRGATRLPEPAHGPFPIRPPVRPPVARRRGLPTCDLQQADVPGRQEPGVRPSPRTGSMRCPMRCATIWSSAG